MTKNWAPSVNRFLRTLSGSKRVDRVPYFPLIAEEMVTRISGKTLKELISSPELYAKAAIMSCEFLQADFVFISTTYAGPSEALAFAEVNGKADSVRWYDYKIFMIEQGAVCKTAEDIENLKIPVHSKLNLWQNCMEATRILQEKTSVPQMTPLGLWCVVQELRGIQAYRDIRRNPNLLMKLCEKVYESQMDLYQYWVDLLGKPRFIFFTGYAFNSHMMSFDDAMQFEGHFIQRMQKEIGVPFILHNCGTAPYFDEVCKEIDLVAINCSHPLDIEYWIEFKKKFPKVTIMGANIDVSREMFNGTTEDVENKVKENILNLAPGGRYVCAPICCLPWGVSMENIMAVPKAVEKYGTYPIKVE